MKRLRSLFIFSFTALVLAGVFYFGIVRPEVGPAGSAAKKIEIKSGAGFREIASLLQAQGFIRSKYVFEIYALLRGRARVLKPGNYEIASGLSLSSIVNVLAKGPEDVQFVLAPGMTAKEADEKLSGLNLIKAGELNALSLRDLAESRPWLTKILNQVVFKGKEELSLEGFLFPDTYRLSFGSTAAEITSKILDNFETKALPALAAKEGKELFYAVTLASLLEKEAPDPEERKIIAGILEKRLEIGMPLQVDAAVVYARCAKKFLNCPPLTKKDYNIDSFYNTYKYKGLPPGPIANPGASAIYAAVHPASSSYLYYLSHLKTKQTIFAKSFDEHARNRVKYVLNN